MKKQPMPLMSRRRLFCIGMSAVAGVIAGCGEPGVSQVEKPAAKTGTRNRLEKFKENAQSALARGKKA
jgi:hypothetical protein